MSTAIESDDAGFIREALGRLYKNRSHNSEYQNAWHIGVRRCADMIGVPLREVRAIARLDHLRLDA